YATLTHADDAAYATIAQRSTQLQSMVAEALDAEGVNHSIQRAGSLFSIAFGTAETGVVNYEDTQAQEAFRYGPFFHAMLDGGVYLAPSVYEAWFISAAHDDSAMNKIAEALPAAAKAAAGQPHNTQNNSQNSTAGNALSASQRFFNTKFCERSSLM